MIKKYGFDKFKWCLEKQVKDGTLSNGEWLAIQECPLENYQVMRETEKAVLCKWSTDYGAVQRWVPKSCIIPKVGD